MKPDIEELRRKYIENPTEGMRTPKVFFPSKVKKEETLYRFPLFSIS